MAASWLPGSECSKVVTPLGGSSLTLLGVQHKTLDPSPPVLALIVKALNPLY